MKRRLVRATGPDRKFMGVCAGIANYLGIDATVVRLAFAFFSIWGGMGIVAYIVCAFVMPEDDGTIHVEYEVKHNSDDRHI